MLSALAGIFKLLGILFYGDALILKKIKDPGLAFDLAVEYAENLVQSIVQLNFKNLVASALLSASLLQSVGPVLLQYLSELDIPPRQAAYFIGFLIGYIIETAISLIFTGGSLTLASVLREAFVAPVRALAGVGKVALRAGSRITKNLLESLIQLINEGLPELIRKLNDPKGFLDEVVEMILRVLKAPEKSIADLIKLVPSKYRSTLRKDFEANPDLVILFSEEVGLVKAWFVLKDAPNLLRRNEAVVEYVFEIIENAKFGDDGLISFSGVKSK